MSLSFIKHDDICWYQSYRIDSFLRSVRFDRFLRGRRQQQLVFLLDSFLMKVRQEWCKKHQTWHPQLVLVTKGLVLLTRDWNWKFSICDVATCWRNRNLSSTTTMIRVESARFTGLLTCHSYSEIFSFSRRFFVIDDNQSRSFLMMNEVWAMLVDLLFHIGQTFSIIIDPAEDSWICEGGFFLSLILFLPSGFLSVRHWEKTNRRKVILAQDASLIRTIERLASVYPEKNKRGEGCPRTASSPFTPQYFLYFVFWFTQPDVMVNARERGGERQRKIERERRRKKCERHSHKRLA